jgi:hypothetical protein
MKIYNVYNGMVHELEVRETKTMYIYDKGERHPAFNHKTRFNKSDGWATTPLEAVRRKINITKEMISSIREASRRNAK